jgi:hypothetical protein
MLLDDGSFVGCHSVSLAEQVPTFLGLLDPDGKGTLILRNTRNCSTKDKI